LHFYLAFYQSKYDDALDDNGGGVPVAGGGGATTDALVIAGDAGLWDSI
jgi:hypothetical protein